MTQYWNRTHPQGERVSRIGAPWRSDVAPHLYGRAHASDVRFGGGPTLARADWLEAALTNLPVVDMSADWQTVVFQRHARRQAEFALAASLRSAQMGRATITMSDTSGTSIRMFGVRAASMDGFAAAATLWIEAVRRQAAADA